MATLATALSTLDTSVAPGPKFLWDSIVADLSRYGKVHSSSTTGFERFIRESTTALRAGIIRPADWNLYTRMREFLTQYMDTPKRVALLTHIINRLYPGRATQDVREVILPAYTRYAATAVWEVSFPDLNRRMKQFMCQVGWMFVVGVTRPIPPTAAELEIEELRGDIREHIRFVTVLGIPVPTLPVVPPVGDATPEARRDIMREIVRILDQALSPAPSAPPAPVEPVAEPMTEPMAEPIVAPEEERPLLRIPRDYDDYEPAECDYEEADYEEEDY